MTDPLFEHVLDKEGTMRKIDEFDVIDDAEAVAIKAAASDTGKRPLSPVTKALLAGETVFLVGRTSYNTKTFTRLGKRMRSARGTRNSRDGVYIWLEDALPEPPAQKA